jgi:hypothetical protein
MGVMEKVATSRADPEAIARLKRTLPAAMGLGANEALCLQARHFYAGLAEAIDFLPALQS